jgi:hypothetical protein
MDGRAQKPSRGTAVSRLSAPAMRLSSLAEGAPLDGFNFAFSLFAIILGLSLVEVLTGFARALKRRRVVRLGWLTPLLAVFVMLDLISFWAWTWSARDYITPIYGVLFIGLVVSGLYYLAASIIFPDEFGEHTDFDAHYVAHRRQVLGAVIACNLIGQGWFLALLWGHLSPITKMSTILYDALLVIGCITANKRLSIAVLSALIALYLYTVEFSMTARGTLPSAAAAAAQLR